MQRMKELSYLGRLHLFEKPVQIIEFIRMLAKIAHSYVTGELWPDKFTPYLTNIILQKEAPITPFGTFKPTFYVGGSFQDEPAGVDLHEISIVKLPYAGLPLGPLANPNEIITRIHLFAKYGCPVYYVVTGLRLSATVPG
jgi:hypothetical protein